MRNKDLSYRTGVPILVGAIVGAIVTSGAYLITAPLAQAATLFSNDGVQFDEDTTLEFNFKESHGVYKSTFGVIDLNTKERFPLIKETKSSDVFQPVTRPSDRKRNIGDKNDFLGTPGNAVPNPTAKFNFKANTRYSFFLDSAYEERPVGTAYSTNLMNPGGVQQAKFDTDPANLCNGGSTIAWDDTGAVLVKTPEQQDTDFDDVYIEATNGVCAVGGGAAPAAVGGGMPPVVAGGGPGFIPYLPLAGLAALPFVLGGEGDNTSTPLPPVLDTVTPPGAEGTLTPSGAEGTLTLPGPGGTVTLPGAEGTVVQPNAKAVPEPSTTIGSLALIGGFLLRRKFKKI
ncbi:hypothetical protein AVDCRST_MAG81-1911 [uncultured Synechococcales cyanobacterium]|uniref:PEP-CTERM protein-sorting domain-containing protein n=1 Tax=uncultured Synechococcales cyanobacterium TaxID=1936017 RepID=A0A6J4UMD7_9CYAN|nr:hypothetical protein AVDCRST_MAG81-1911 [uncultured Synechococcales cyanobacterium]